MKPDLVEKWWRNWPDALIGAPPYPDEVVLDIDPRNGGTRKVLEEAIGQLLPVTLTAYSGRGDDGAHHYFKRPNGPLSARRLPPGFDLKTAESGYLILPPSPHPDTGKPYWWADPEVAVAEMPVALAELLRPAPAEEYAAPVVAIFGGRPTAGKLAGLCRTVAEATEGNRNKLLYWAGKRLAEDNYPVEAWILLAKAGRESGLPDGEVMRSLCSAGMPQGTVLA